MPLPLLWLGAAALSAIAVNELKQDRKTCQSLRGKQNRVLTLNDINSNEFPVMTYPSDVFTTEQCVQPQIGAIVCCGVAGILDHTGIWIGDNTIAELDGNGLIKPISSQRFIKERSGKQIFIACDSLAQPLASDFVSERAIKQLFSYQDYHVLYNNCHQFVWQCFPSQQSGEFQQNITTFRELNYNIAHYFNRVIYWDALQV